MRTTPSAVNRDTAPQSLAFHSPANPGSVVSMSKSAARGMIIVTGILAQSP
jgi:hypothetical protein